MSVRKPTDLQVAKLKAATILQNLIMDGEFEDQVKPVIWKFIDKLRAKTSRPSATSGHPAGEGVKNVR